MIQIFVKLYNSQLKLLLFILHHFEIKQRVRRSLLPISVQQIIINKLDVGVFVVATTITRKSHELLNIYVKYVGRNIREVAICWPRGGPFFGVNRLVPYVGKLSAHCHSDRLITVRKARKTFFIEERFCS